MHSDPQAGRSQVGSGFLSARDSLSQVEGSSQSIPTARVLVE